jgi:WD40 repeat protein
MSPLTALPFRERHGNMRNMATTRIVWAAALVLCLSSAFSQTVPNVRWVQGGIAAVVQSIAYSHDGRLLATASMDGTIKLWRVSDGTLARTLPIRPGEVRIAFSPDGRTIASQSQTAVTLFRVKDGALVFTKTWNAGSPAIAFSRDGSYIATTDNGAVQILRASDGSIAHNFNSFGGATQFDFSPDGQKIVITGGFGSQICRVKDGQILALLGGIVGIASVYALYSPDGHWIASSSNNDVKLCDPITGVVVATLQGHTAAVGPLAFSSDGQSLISGSSDKSVILWDLAVLSLKQVLMTGSDGAINCVAISPDGDTVAAPCINSGNPYTFSIKLWNAADGSFLKNLVLSTGKIRAAAMSSNSDLFAWCDTGKTVHIFRATDGAPLTTFNAQATTASVAFGANDEWLATANDNPPDDGMAIKVWETDGTPRLGMGQSIGYASLAVSPLGNRIAAGAYITLGVEVYDPSSGSLIRTLKGNKEFAGALAFSPDGLYLVAGYGDATAGKDDSLRLWRISDGALLKTMTGHSSGVIAVAYAPDGIHIASAAHDATIKIWKTDGTLMWTLTGHTNTIQALAFSPDGATLMSASLDGPIRMWDVASGNLLTILNNETYPGVVSAAFSPDGRWIGFARTDDSGGVIENPYGYSKVLCDSIISDLSDQATSIDFEVSIDGEPKWLTTAFVSGSVATAAITGPANGSHTLSIHPVGHLGQTVTYDVTGQQQTVQFNGNSSDGLAGGDADMDNIVTLQDLSAIFNDFSGAPSEFDLFSDIDGDGIVTDYDLNLVLVNFGTVGN